jgi:hypothetical protein
MGYCGGVSDWLLCLKCERLCSAECPIQRGDIEELIHQLNRAEARSEDFFLGGMDGHIGNA